MKNEQEVLEFWQKNNIAQKSFEIGKKPFVFYEGPPTANGKPGIHHMLSRAYKDVILRYKSMKGFVVERKAGWDTHGLPVEIEVEKKLGISGKKQIENIVAGNRFESIKKFNELCRESVWTYKEIWEDFTKRIGFWLDLEHPYITYENSYIEKLWEIINKIHERGLLTKSQKIISYCPRCETSLSSHELAQGYKDANDPSIFVLLKLSGKNEYLLIWTTTPWTLPANLAVAINTEEKYGLYQIEEKKVWLASSRAKALNIVGEPDAVLLGKQMLGWKYEPLYKSTQANEKCYQIYTADFVSMEEGTGLVHVAPGFGEDDYNLGNEIGLPFLVTIDQTGKINIDVPGKGKFIKEADRDIAKDLRDRGSVFKLERIVHSYPFCWRCDTPVIYVARESWFITMSKLRSELVSENEKISWLPKHLKEGRFGNWLTEVKDWAFSRERYWGTPLPIWHCQIGKDKSQKSKVKSDQGCGNIRVIGSQEELKPFIKNRNKFIFVRHGESEKNLFPKIATSKIDGYPLTENGIKQAGITAKKLKEIGVSKIYSSPVERAKQTAQIISQEIGIDLLVDDRLWELNTGKMEGKPVPDKENPYHDINIRWDENILGMESYQNVTKRMVDFITEVNSVNKGETIVVVSHGDPLWLLEAEMLGKGNPLDVSSVSYPEVAQTREVPVNVIDLHRPFIDEIEIPCEKCQGKMKREPYVCDVWFDSGAMPFATGEFEAGRYPADYICEAIDQTRGWYYTLLAVGVLMQAGTPFKNVISLNHILDAKGQKMSKSKGNVVDPWEMIERYSADSVRMYFFSVNKPGENKLFNEKDLSAVHRKTILLLNNIVNFVETYAQADGININELSKKGMVVTPKRLLNKWVNALTHRLIFNVDKKLKRYDVTGASRDILEFINDFSTWYLRRSRKERTPEFYQTIIYVLKMFAIVSSPLMPFESEIIFNKFKSEEEPQSVHLTNIPDVNEYDKNIIEKMDKIRGIVAKALALRAESENKVRQPLSKLTVKGYLLDQDELEIIKDEINVLNVETIESKKQEILLDTTLTEELKEQGIVREIIRTIQNARKKAGYNFDEPVSVEITSSLSKEKLTQYIDEIETETITKIIDKLEKADQTVENKDIVVSVASA